MATDSLPPSPKMPLFLRRIKFVFQPIEYVEDFAQVYGDCFALDNGDNPPIVYFSQPEALQQIFALDGTQLDAGRGNMILRFLLGENSLVLLDGRAHQRQRQLLTPPFHGDRIRVYGETIREITQQVSHSWKIGKPFPIRDSMQEITLRVILRVVFGLDEGQHLEEIRQLLTSMLEALGSPWLSAAVFFRFLQKDLGAWSPWSQMLRQRQKIDDLIYELIQERRAELQQNRQDILSLMMSARDPNGQPMTDEELHDELMTLLTAGHETTASALTWALYWVAYLPNVREKLQQELDGLGENPDPNIIAKLPYLTAVCQESLRIYPVAMTSFPRIVKSPVEIMGYKLPVGTLIIPSIYMAHHREAVYSQSKQFKPERFLERQFSPYEYLPFGGGSRRCIGMVFAQYEMKVVLATILSRFQLSLLNHRLLHPVRRGVTVAAPSDLRMIATFL